MRVLSLVALLAVYLLPQLVPGPIHACSGDGVNPVESSKVIVMGTVATWEEASSPPGLGIFQSIRLTIEVDRILKGTPTDIVYAYDVASFIRRDQGSIGGTWGGPSSACGALAFDPTGKYVVLGLWLSDDGSLLINKFRTFYIGDKTKEAEAAALERLSGFGLIIPPTTGSGGLR